MSQPNECYVSVRLYGGAYLARVRGSKAVASCTSDAAAAARRAAGKHLRVIDQHVVLRAITARLPGRYAYAATIAEKGGAR